jgi:Uncharacterized protein conserved in bacteria
VNAVFGPVILVIGMHRSGTSAVTRVLNLLGIELGGSLLPSADDNARGFWEHQDAVLINERLLSALGRNWFDLRELPHGWLSTPAASEAKLQLKELFTREFGGPVIWAVKDPRICRLLPLWRSVLEELGVKAHALFMVRHPNEVAQSLQARDGISVRQSRLAWVQHMAEAEISSRGIPRSVMLYDDLLTHWSSSMERVAAELGIRWPIDVGTVDTAVQDFLEPAARHYSVAENTTVELPRLVQEIYDALVSVARGTGSWSAVSALSSIYDEVAGSFLVLLEDIVPRADEGDGQVLDLGARLDALLGNLEVRLATIEGYVTDNKIIDDVAKLYFRAADQFHAEDRAVPVKHDGLGVGCRIKFELPVREKIDFLRFDPSEFGGTFDIFELRLDDVALENMGRHVTAVNQCRLAPGPSGSLRISSIDNDPYIEFALEGAGGPATFQTCTVGVRRESLHSRMLDVCADAMRSAVAELRAAEVEGARVALEPLQRSVEDIRDGQAMFDKLQSHHRQQLEELRLHQRETMQQLQALSAQMEGGRGQMDELKELQRGAQEREVRREAELNWLREAIVAHSTGSARDGQAMFDKLESRHRQQLEELELHRRETMQQLQALSAQMKGGRGQMEELKELQRGMREREVRHEAEMDSLREAVTAQSANISSLAENAIVSQNAMRAHLEVLVRAYEHTLSARWHRWLRKRPVE